MATRVTYDVRSGVAHMRLNRPEKRNALDEQMVQGIIAALERFQEDPDARAGVLSGDGLTFCAGGDLTTFPAIGATEGLRAVRDDGERIYKFFSRTRKPVIAAVHGAAIAGGFEIALGAHFIYAARDTSFGLEEIRIGLIPGLGGTVRLPRAIPTRMATELLLTGRRIDTTEAHRIGLVNRVLKDATTCLEAAQRTAEEIASMPTLAVEFAMDVIRASRDENDSAFSLEQAAAATLFGSAETHRRIDELLERGIGVRPRPEEL